MTRLQIAGFQITVDLMVGILLAIISIVCLYWLIPNHVSSTSGSHDIPPDFIPRLGAWIVLILSGVLIAGAVLKPSALAGDLPLPGRKILFEALVVLGVIFFIATTLEWLGFYAMAIPVIVIGMYVAGGRNPVFMMAFATAFSTLLSLGTWHIFTVQLP